MFLCQLNFSFIYHKTKVFMHQNFSFHISKQKFSYDKTKLKFTRNAKTVPAC